VGFYIVKVFNDICRSIFYYKFIAICFFVFDKLGLIAYPHDDTGFGFIRIRNTKVHYEDMFLKNISQFSDYISVW